MWLWEGQGSFCDVWWQLKLSPTKNSLSLQVADLTQFTHTEGQAAPLYWVNTHKDLCLSLSQMSVPKRCIPFSASKKTIRTSWCQACPLPTMW